MGAQLWEFLFDTSLLLYVKVKFLIRLNYIAAVLLNSNGLYFATFSFKAKQNKSTAKKNIKLKFVVVVQLHEERNKKVRSLENQAASKLYEVLCCQRLVETAL